MDLNLTNQPLISVLIRSIGLKKALEEAIRSVEAQDYPNIEIVLIEDGAATLNEFITNFSKCPINYHALGENKGRSAAGNVAMNLAKGEYMTFLDEDDMFYPSHISTLVNEGVKDGELVSYSFAEEMGVETDEEGMILKKSKPFLLYNESQFSFLWLIKTNFLPINTVLFHRSLYEKLGGFDEDLDALEDWLLWIKFAANVGYFKPVPKVTALYTVPISSKIYFKRRAKIRNNIKIVEERLTRINLSFSLDILKRDLQENFYLYFKLKKVTSLSLRLYKRILNSLF
jgi:glycosyltransferase involved in cell wall biosynthesis